MLHYYVEVLCNKPVGTWKCFKAVILRVVTSRIFPVASFCKNVVVSIVIVFIIIIIIIIIVVVVVVVVAAAALKTGLLNLIC
jgi:hypothetical protein